MSNLTPAGHRERAETDLAFRDQRGYQPGSPAYQSLTLSAIAHTLAAIAFFLEPPPEPEVPGLPPGWKITTRRSTAGDRLWGYMLTSPQGKPCASRFSWGSSDTALAAGLSAARTLDRSARVNGM